MPSKLAKFMALTADQKRWFVLAAAVGPLAWMDLRVRGLAARRGWLSAAAGRAVFDAAPAADVTRLAELAGSACRLTPFPSTCLSRSMALVWLLARRGLASQLCIGVQIEQGQLAAHAWVEYNQTPINDRADIRSQFATFSACAPMKSFSAQ